MSDNNLTKIVNDLFSDLLPLINDPKSREQFFSIKAHYKEQFSSIEDTKSPCTSSIPAPKS